MTTDPFDLTDLGNAKRLHFHHGSFIRFVPAEKAFYVYDGICWRRDETGEVERRAKKTVLEIGEAARRMRPNSAEGIERQKQMGKWAMRSQSAQRIRAMMDLVKSEPNVSAAHDVFDREPGRLNCRNGIVDLQTAAISLHLPRHNVTKCIDAEYDADAEAPAWDAFLKRIIPNEEMREFLQRAMGYTAFGNGSEQVLFVAFGLGANGKSTFLDAVRHALGPYAATTEVRTFAIRGNDVVRNDLARLAGVHMVTASEPHHRMSIDESLVKQMTGGSPIAARFLYGEYFEFTPRFVAWIDTNHKPTIKGTDHGIWRRIMLIPFDQTIGDGERDRELPAKLRSERAGILAWLVKGAVAWQQNGLAIPDSVRAATAVYRRTEDQVGQFIEQCCELGGTLSCLFGALYDRYTWWAEAQGFGRMSARTFSDKLRERGFESFERGKSHTTTVLGVQLTSRANQSNAETASSDVCDPVARSPEDRLADLANKAA